MFFTLIKAATKTGLGLIAAQQTLQQDLPWALLEAKLNEICQSTLGANEIIDSLDGQSIQFVITPLSFMFNIQFIHGQLVIKSDRVNQADASIRISTMDNINQWLQGNHQLKYKLDGNFETLLAFQQLLRTLDIEVSDCLLPYLGPQLTAIVIQGLRGFTQHFGASFQKIRGMGESFMNNEQPFFVRPKDLQNLQTKLREKSFDIERLEARLQQLEAKLN